MSPSVISASLPQNPIAVFQPAPPYDFAKLLDFLGRFAHPTLDYGIDGIYRRVIRQGEALALVEVVSNGDGGLAVYCRAQRGSIDILALVETMRYVLGVEEPHADFFEWAMADTTLAEIFQPVVGLPLLRTASLFEALVCVIIEQQIAWRSALRAQNWLFAWGEQGLEYSGRTYYACPTPAQLAATTVEDLKPLKITFRRMQLLIDLAQQIEGGHLPLETWRDNSPQTVYQELLQLKGIGHWTATVIVERALGYRAELITTNDVALQAAVNRYFYGQSGRLTPMQLGETLGRYGNRAGTVAVYTLLRWVVDNYESP